MQEVLEIGELEVSLPGGAVEARAGVEAVGGGANLVCGEQGEALGGEREARGAIGEGAVAREIAAGGEVAGKGRGPLPHLAAAAGEAEVSGGELLPVDDKDALAEEEEQEQGGDLLGAAQLE